MHSFLYSIVEVWYGRLITNPIGNRQFERSTYPGLRIHAFLSRERSAPNEKTPSQQTAIETPSKAATYRGMRINIVPS